MLQGFRQMPSSIQIRSLEQVREVLGRDDWFGQMRHEHLDAFVSKGALRRLRPDEIFICSGDLVKSLGVVIEGTLHASRSNAAGKRHIIGYFGPLQVVNFIPILDGQRCVHDISAHHDALVLTIPKDVFLEALDQDPAIARAVIRVLCLRSRALYENASDNVLRPLRARCARMLSFLMASHGKPINASVSITLKLSQDELADMLGRTRQSVNRELKQMERDGIISMRYSHFIIRDVQALRDLVENEGAD